MNIFIEEQRIDVDGPSGGDSTWLTSGAVQYLKAVVEDLKSLDPNFQLEDSQRLVQRIWLIVRAAQARPATEFPNLERGITTAFHKIPQNVQTTVQTKLKVPVETTLELLVRTLAQKQRPPPRSLSDYYFLLNKKLPHVINTLVKLIREEASMSSGMPKILFICVGPHAQNDPPVHVITTTREKYSADPNDENALNLWSMNTFRDRLRQGNQPEYDKLLACSRAFYTKIAPDDWEQELLDSYAEGDAALAEMATWMLKSDQEDKLHTLRKANHKANGTAAWLTQSSTETQPNMVFDHSRETAMAFDINRQWNCFYFRARCFRRRGFFRYHQIPYGTQVEANFPWCWQDQEHGLFCGEVLGHLHCLAASARNPL